MKRRVALVFIGNIEFCPYMKEYQQILNDLQIDYDVIFWKRDNLSLKYPQNYHFFDLPSSLRKKKYLKIFDFIRYTLWLKKFFERNHYTHLIFLDTLSGIIGYLLGVIKKDVHAVLEIRDYSYEKIKLFKLIESKVIDKVEQVFISSPAFQRFLPKHDYCVTHNFNAIEYKENYISRSFAKKVRGTPLNIVYVGTIRYFNYQKAIIEELKNDSNFNISFHGIGADYRKLKQYCTDKNIKNVEFTGLYTSAQKAGFYKKADIIINCYDIHIGNEVMYAISNKFYDGLIYHLPQISESKTYKGKLIEKYHLGITWQPQDGKLKEKIMNFYYSIDENKFNKSCIEKMEDYYIEYKRYTERIIGFLQQD